MEPPSLKLMMMHVERGDREEKRELYDFSLGSYANAKEIRQVEEFINRLLAAVVAAYGTHADFEAENHVNKQGGCGYFRITGILRDQQVPEVIAFIRGYLARETEQVQTPTDK